MDVAHELVLLAANDEQHLRMRLQRADAVNDVDALVLQPSSPIRYCSLRRNAPLARRGPSPACPAGSPGSANRRSANLFRCDKGRSLSPERPGLRPPPRQNPSPPRTTCKDDAAARRCFLIDIEDILFFLNSVRYTSSGIGLSFSSGRLQSIELHQVGNIDEPIDRDTMSCSRQRRCRSSSSLSIFSGMAAATSSRTGKRKRRRCSSRSSVRIRSPASSSRSSMSASRVTRNRNPPLVFMFGNRLLHVRGDHLFDQCKPSAFSFIGTRRGTRRRQLDPRKPLLPEKCLRFGFCECCGRAR